MSQRGSATRPASSGSSKSPITLPTSSNSLQQSLRPGGEPQVDDRFFESGDVSRPAGERSQPNQRALVNILNPADPPASLTTNFAAAPFPSPAEERNPYVQTTSSQWGSSPSSSQPFMPPGSQQSSPGVSGRQFSFGAPVERQSPSVSHPSLAPGAPRRFLTPRSPRASSISHGPPLRLLNPNELQNPPAAPTGPGRRYPVETGPEISPHLGPGASLASQAIGTGHPGLPPQMSNLAISPPSLSQPPLGQYGSTTPEQQTPFQAPMSNTLRPSGFISANLYSTHRGFPQLPLADSRWSDGRVSSMQQGPSRLGPVPVSEGHHLFAINPEAGDQIIVNIDTQQGSRQADEKRLRNAGASARFRQRKKVKESLRETAMQKLESQNRELERKVRDLEVERDRYRSERDRLRDIVLRTPNISDLAYQGLPSPTPSRSGISHTERSPLVGVPAPPPLPVTAYGQADAMTGERTTRRRRTDPQVEFIPPSCAPGQGSLPPMMPVYTAPISQPSTPSAHNSRLPPLRMDLPPTSEPGSVNTPTQSFSPYRRETYETGWAIRPSGLPGPPGYPGPSGSQESDPS